MTAWSVAATLRVLSPVSLFVALIYDLCGVDNKAGPSYQSRGAGPTTAACFT